MSAKKRKRVPSTTPNIPALPPKPVLTDAKGMGGVNAQDGFDYQIWDGLIRLPAWLRLQSFEGMTFEGLEDLETRFFSAHAPKGHFLDRFQAKSGELAKPGIVEVLKSFAAFEHHHPEIARIQTLVTPSVPPALKWLDRDPQRVRNLRPFYEPFPRVLADSDAKVRADFESEFGDVIGGFAFRSVDVAIRAIHNRNMAALMFANEMATAFPAIDVSAKRMGDVFDALHELATRKRGTMLTHMQLIATIEQSLGMSLGLPTELHLHIRSDRSSPESDAVEIDASPFSGGGLGVPSPTEWRDRLLTPLETAARWAYSAGYRRIRISGQFRLSTGFTLGWAFRSATGFELLIPAKEATWATDTRPPSGAQPVPYTATDPSANVGECLIVAMGVLRHPAADVRQHFELADDNRMLRLQVPQALSSALEAQFLAGVLKTRVAEVVGGLEAKAIDLFLSALLRWLLRLATGGTPCHRHRSTSGTQRRVPTSGRCCCQIDKLP